MIMSITGSAFQSIDSNETDLIAKASRSESKKLLDNVHEGVSQASTTRFDLA